MANEMSAAEGLRGIFADELAMDPALVTDDLQYNVAPEWDSAAHMYLVAAIEEKYDIAIPDDEVAGMTTFPAVVRIVSRLIGSR